MRNRPLRARLLLPMLVLLATAACRSPFNWPDEEDEVGVGVHAWPVLEHEFEGDEERLEVLWPLYITRHDRAGELESIKLVATLIRYEEGPDGRTGFGFRPLYDIDTWEAAPDDFDLDLLWPIVKTRRRGDGRLFAVRPLYWSGEDENGSYTILLPLYGSGTNENGSWSFLFPLLWSGETDERRWHHVAPLYWSGGDESGDWRVLFPVAWRGENDVERWNHYAPLYWSGESHDGKRAYRILFPFFWKGRAVDGTFLHYWPFYGRYEKGTYVQHSVLFPLFAHGTDPATNAVTWDVTPLFHYGTSDAGTQVRALPLLWHESSPDGEATVVFPLWWSLDDGDSSYHVLFPFWGRQREGDDFERTFAGGPLWIHTRDGDETSTDILWPLVNFTESDDASSFRVFPLVMHERGEDGYDTDVLWPLINFSGDADRSGYRVFPLVRHENTHGATETDVLWPLFKHEAEGDAPGDEWRTHLFPLLWAGEENDDSWFHLWPLAGKSRDGSKTEVSTLYPLFRYQWDEDDPDAYRLGALWPFAGAQRRGGETKSWVFPLWHGKSDATSSSGRIGLILSNWERKADGDHDFRILWRLVEHRHESDRTTFAVRPLWRNESNLDGDSYWSALGGLLSRKEEDGDVDWGFLWIF